MYGVDKRVEVRAAHAAGKKIKQIVKELEVSRGFARSVIRAATADATYTPRKRQPMPKMAEFAARLEAMLEADAARPKKDRLKLTRIFDLLQREGYAGGYDAVRRFALKWRAQTKPTPPTSAFIPLSFAPGEAFQFDWSHETVVLAGATTTVKVAQVRLAHSRQFYVRAYLRETQEMVFDAHDKAFAFFGGAPSRGVYDNMKTAVDLVFVGKDRTFNRRFLLLADHYRFTPTACTPAAGWEKGQVERQVGVSRERIFKPTLRVASLAELNDFLEAECRRLCATQNHPEERGCTIEEMFAREQPFLSPLPAPFAGFHERDTSANGLCLVTYDRNKYSVMSKAARRPVQLRASAERIVILCDGEIVADHPRCFTRDKTIYDPWHYVPILACKPGAWRNGAPFRDWVLPPQLAEFRVRLGRGDDADRRFVRVLAMAIEDGVEAVEDAIAEALAAGAVSDDVILNSLARRREPPPPPALVTPPGLKLTRPPKGDCARYDLMRQRIDHATP